MKIKDKLISNATYLSLNWSFFTLFSIVFWIILGKTVSPESYGIVALFYQIVIVLSTLSTLGLDSAISRLIPELLERKRNNEIQGLIFFSFKLIFIASLAIAIILTIFSSQLSNFLKLQKEILWIVSVLIIIVSSTVVFDYIYHGFQNMKKLFLTNFCGGASKVLFTLLFVFLNLDYFGAIIAIFLSYIIIVLTRIEKSIFKISKNPIVNKKLILKFSIPAFIVIVFSSILNESQFILLSSMKTAEITGLFAVGMKISSVISIIPIILLSSLAPIISGLSADKNSKHRQAYLIKLVFRYNLFLIIPIAIFLVILSKYAILFFSSSEYLSATNILIILAIAYAFRGLGSYSLSNLYSIGDPKRYRDAQIISSLTYLFLAIPSIYYFSAAGLAISFLISAVLLSFLSAFFLKKHLSFLPPIKDISKIILGCLISSLFLLLVIPHITNYFSAAGFAIVASFIYGLSLLKMKFYLQEDLIVLDFLSQKFPIFGKKIKWIRNYISKYVDRSYKQINTE